MNSRKALAQARRYFHTTGQSITSWAQTHGVNPATVYEVLAGRKKCLRGDAHKVAVKLGIKSGVIIEEGAVPPPPD